MNSTQAFAAAIGVGSAEWDKAHEDYEVLKVGRENLLTDTTDFSSNWGIISDTVTMKGQTWVVKGYDWVSSQILKVSPNTEYVISADCLITEDYVSNARLFIHQLDVNGESISTYSIYSSTSAEVGVITRFSGRLLTLPNTDRLRMYLVVADVNEKCLISHPKLEKGNSSSPYTPAPQDINASPFTVKLAQDYYQQQEEINELRNAILQGGN